jgi:glutaredoxin 3
MGSFFDKPSVSNGQPTENGSYYDQFIKKLVSENQVVIFSKTKCGFCHRAKSILDESKIRYQSIELDVNANCPNDNCTQLTNSLVLQTRMRTVPQIFINGQLIGGCNDLEAILSKNAQFLNSLPKKG